MTSSAVAEMPLTADAPSEQRAGACVQGAETDPWERRRRSSGDGDANGARVRTRRRSGNSIKAAADHRQFIGVLKAAVILSAAGLDDAARP